MSKVVKGIGKAASGIARGIKKGFKRLTRSKFGKLVLAGLAIYLGGSAMGAWGGPGGAAGAGGGVTAAEGVAAAGEAAAASGAAGGAAAGTSAGEIAAGMGAEAAALDAGATAAQASMAGSQAAAGIAGSSAAGSGTGLLSSLQSFWANASPLEKYSIMQGIGTMMSPDEVDMLKEQEAILEKRRRQQQKNLAVGDIDIGLGGRGAGIQSNLQAPVRQTNGMIGRRINPYFQNRFSGGSYGQNI